MAVAPDVNLTGKIATATAFDLSPTTSQPEMGSFEIALCGYGSIIPRVAGEAVFGRVTSTEGEADSDGHFQVVLYNNTLISPEDTYYTVAIKDSNGDVVQVNAYRFPVGGTFELDTLEPIDPNQPPPQLRPDVLNLLLIVPFSPTPEFPGDLYTSWQILLTGDAAPTFTNLVDGNLYTIIVVQDSSGDHRFLWPSNVYNATMINPEANGMTIQTFVAISNLLYPIGAGTYFP